MGAPTIRRGRLVGGVLVVVVVLVLPVVLLLRGAEPPSSGPSAAGVATAAPELADECARVADGPDELAREYGAARTGQTVCLKSGDYGTFRGGRKPGLVGVRAQHGAHVKLALELDTVVNLQIEDVTITSARIEGVSRNITIKRSRFTGLALVRADRLENANIVFDHNRHDNVDTCVDGCFQGRLHIDGNTGRPSGVVVKNSVFSGGNSDGVRADAAGIKVLHNEFYGFRDEDPFHTDPIQIYGGTDVEVRGNYFHDNDVSAQIMMADGGRDNIVEDNVISGSGYTWAITWFSDVNSIIQHNTFGDGTCSDNVRCGMINLGAKARNPAGRGTVIRNNVMGGISNGSEGAKSHFEAVNNLTAVRTEGHGNIVGTPRFRGPLGRYDGYRLAPDSPGVQAASDGGDTGIR